MKILVLLLILFVLNAGRPANGAPLVRVDKARIESLARKAIAQKYPDLKPKDLTFDAIEYSLTADGVGEIGVCYRLPGVATEEDTVRYGVTNRLTTTRYKTVEVTMTSGGKVTGISQGTGMSLSSQTK